MGMWKLGLSWEGICWLKKSLGEVELVSDKVPGSFDLWKKEEQLLHYVMLR